MSDEIRNKVLQVIAKLRSQKARPDIYRISYRLEKLHGVSADRTKRELDRLVADKKLYRVDFKGNHSYRIVKPTKPGGSDDVGMAELLVSALTELTAPQGRKPRKNAGASLKELRKQIYKDDNARNIRFLPQKSVEWTKLLDRLCTLNTLALQTNGKYILVEAPKDVDKRQSDPLTAKLTEKQHAELMKRESGSGGISRSSADDAINDDVPLSLVAGSDSDAEDSKPIAFLASMAVTPSTQGTKAESPCPSPSLPDPDAGETGNANAPSSSAAAVSAPPDDDDDDDDDDVTGVTEARPEDGAGSADRNNSQHVSRDKKVSTRKQRAIKRKRCDTPTPATTTATGIGPAADLLGCVSRKKHAPNKSGPVKKQTQTKSEAKATTMTMLPTAVSTSPPYKFVDHQPTCDFCLLPAERSGDVLDSLLSCSDCQARAHPSCMHYSKELANRARLAKWQCIDCKVCCVCHDAHEEIHLQGDEMLFCDSCDKGYHMNCHFPAVESKPKATEYCDKYEVAYSRYPFVNKEKIPNATSWQVEDVHSYLADKGFEEQALEFKKQEIDGPSLLLMKRKDVLNSLPLRLGPALKIYYHIECLQRVALRDCLYTPSSPSSPISS